MCQSLEAGFFFSFDLFQGGSTPRQRSREAWCLLRLLVRQRKIGDNKGVNKGVNKVCYRDIAEAIPMGTERKGGLVLVLYQMKCHERQNLRRCFYPQS